MPCSDCPLEISELTVVMASASLQDLHFNYFGAGRGLSPFLLSETSASRETCSKHSVDINYNYYYWVGKEKLTAHNKIVTSKKENF